MSGTTMRRALRELVLVAALFLAYKMGRLLVEGHTAEAVSNASAVWNFERALHLPDEAGLQAGLLHHEWWVRAANCFYAYVHFPATAIALIWMYVRKPDVYLWMRRTLATLTAFALVIHALYPLAPPRMLTWAGLVDTGHLFGPSVYGSPSTDTLSNQYAAMPSLHVGWAIVLALALATATAGWRRWLWLAHPALTLIVVVVTGNHYWVDALAVMGLIAVVHLLVPCPTTPADRLAVPVQRPALTTPLPAAGAPASRPPGRPVPSPSQPAARTPGSRSLPTPRTPASRRRR